MTGRIKTSSRRLLPLIAIFLLALVISCGSSTEPAAPQAAATSAPQPTATSAPAASGGVPTATPYAYAARSVLQELDEKYPWPPKPWPWPPRRGGVIQLTMSPIPDVDPTRARNNENLAQYDALLEWESTWWFPEVHTTPTIRPNIAASWEAVDLKTWDFKINQDARFHDRPPMNGRPVTAEDVKYSFDLLRVVPQYTATASVDSVEVIDQETVRFHLKQALAGFPTLYTNGSTPPIVAKEAQESPGGLGENPGGTGAFTLKEFAAGEGLSLIHI